MSERELFIAALNIPEPAERAAWLDRECGDDAALRQRIDVLLRALDKAGSLLENPAVAVDRTLAEPIAEAAGAVIGPYKLLQQIGEGGMGVVWMAQQTEPVKRLVALKLIKAGMDSKQVIARFEAERQALAVMDHVNIARVFDGGTTPPSPPSQGGAWGGGRPYFVMELVHGVPITKYCDDNHLTPRERLELFVPVCQAIQHAHQKGIIHRDIKPSNVMVTLYDGRPVPKVIDFGVAKATEQRLTEQTLFTQFGTMIGTLEYMSPEQAEMSALGVDTRSDIYSLGVLLYELLAGSTPLTHKRMKEAAYAEILRMIKEEEPPRPSVRLSDSGVALASISAQRHMEPAKLTKLVRGELDWIVMKTLEKDRNRRYETASGFAADVQRYLNDEPVQACPPSAAYKLRKFVRRNKGPVVAASLVVLALVGGIIGTTWGMIRATDAEAGAKLSAQDAKTKEGLATEAQQDAVESLKDALAAVDQMLTRVSEERLVNVPQMEPIRKDLLQDALKFYQKFLRKKSDDPVIRREAALAYYHMASIHLGLGQSGEAEVELSTAIAMFKKLDKESRLEPRIRSELIGIHLTFSWIVDGEERERNVRRAVEIGEQLVKEFPKDPYYRLLLANASNQLFNLIAQTQPEEAEKILTRNLSLTNDPSILWGTNTNLRSRIIGEIHGNLGYLSAARGRKAEVETHYREALKHIEKAALAHPNDSSLMTVNVLQGGWAGAIRRLARSVATNGRPKEAEELQRRAVSVLDKVVTNWPAVPLNRDALATAYIEHTGFLRALNRMAEAEEAYRRALAVYDKLATDFRTIPAYQQLAFDHRLGLGGFLIEVGRLKEALQVYEEAVALPEKLSVDIPAKLKHWHGLVHRHMELGRLLGAAGKPQQAEAAYGQVVAIQEKVEAALGSKPEFRSALVLSHLEAANLLKSADQMQGAEKLYRRAVEQSERLLTDSPTLAEASKLHGNVRTQFHEFLRIPEMGQELRKNFALSLKLVADFPDRKDNRDRLFKSCFALAHFLNNTGRKGKVGEPYGEIMTLYKVLADKFPLASEHRASSVDIHWHLCHMLKAAGRLADAETSLRQNFAMSVQLVGDFPTATDCHEYLSRSRRALTELFRATDRLPEATQPCRDVLTLYIDLVARFPAERVYRQRLADCSWDLGVILKDTHRAQEILPPYREVHALYAKLMARFPEAPEYRTGLVESYLRLHELLAATDQFQDADQAYGDLVKLAGNDARLYEHVAWRLVMRTAPAKAYEAAQAVDAAKKAVALAPQEGQYWRTLGIAHYYTGDWKAARTALEKSVDLGYARSTSLFFLAMAHGQLGNENEARQRYDEAVVWMEQKAKNARGLQRFRDEAALVLFVRPLATLAGHSSDVRWLEFTPDGKTLATGSFDTTVKFWDVVTGRELVTLRGHTSGTNGRFSRDGMMLATAGGLDGTIKLWDVNSRKELASFKGHTGGVLCVEFTPDGKTLASTGRADSLVKIWDVGTANEIATLKGHSKPIECVIFSPNGETLASGGVDGQLKLWRVATWKERGSLLLGSWIRSIAISPDGQTLAAGCISGTVHLRDATTGNEQRVLKGLSGWVNSVAFSPDGKTLASGDSLKLPGTVKLWDAHTGRELASIAHSGGVRTVAFSPDGITLASGGEVPDVKLWDVSRLTTARRR